MQHTFPEVEYNRFFNLVESLGNQLNERKNRFDKSDVLECATAWFSQGKLEWVDQVGYDHVYDFITSGVNLKSEQKTQQHVLYTKTGSLKKTTAAIRLLNTLGDDENRTYESKYDVLQIVDTGGPHSFSVALASPEVVHKYVKKTKDCFTVQIPTDELIFLFRPEEYKSRQVPVIANYLKEKRAAQMRLIEQF
jgi:hypothetical protein|tara:strand:- start:544 stop:1122 length:579 start_codon:yes stop_codon:yes gene_type:complete